MLTTFILILITWTFFRAESITEALSINHKIFADIIELLSGRGSLLMLDEQIGSLGIEPEQLTGLLLGIVLLIVIDILLEKNVLKSYTSKIPRFGIRITDYALVAFIIFFGNFGSQAFIYFQF